MDKKALPLAIIAVVALIGLVVFLAKKNLSGPEAKTSEEAGYPSFIDPVTRKPKGMGGPGNASSAGAPPGMGQRGPGGSSMGGPPGMGQPGGPR